MRILLTISLLATIEVATLSPLQILAMPFHMNRYFAPQFGGIEGTVVDGNGQPISGSIVYAAKTDFVKGAIPVALTDKLGKFTLKSLPPGIYKLSAKKEDDGYPDTESLFHYGRLSANHLLQVTVNENQITQNVIVKTGTKMGLLAIRVVNAVTKELIKSAKVTLRRLDNPGFLYITGPYDGDGAIKKIPVPSAPFTVEVSAPGYAIWRFRKEGSQKQADSLQVAQGETKKLDVLLSNSK